MPVGSRWIIPVGVGKKEELTLERVRQAAASGSRRALMSGFNSFSRGVAAIDGASLEETAQAVTEGTILGLYRYLEFKTSTDEDRREIKSVTWVVKNQSEKKEAEAGIKRGQTLAEAVCWARTMINHPANRLTPTMMAKEAASASRQFGFSCRVLDPSQMKKLGMGAVLAVAQGSCQPARFIIMEYKGKGAHGAHPLVFLGKGITFDSGGISIKPADTMEQRKDDMSGGAAVLGAMRAIAGLKLPLHVVGLVPATENLPGGSAQKPGDVIRAYGGRTIEVINTDAEGRLVLADALEYAKKYKPAAMVDLATLTGACVVALGTHAMGLMTNDAKWGEDVRAASNRVGERAWELPLWPEYADAIRSDVADVKNVGDGKAGTITAGYFLREFAGDIPWVHLDIAGMAWADATKGYHVKGATGVGVRLLVDLAEHWKGGR